MEQQQQHRRENVYRDHLIPEGPVTFPMGNCPSHESLSCEYQMAALGWSSAHVTGNSYLKQSFKNQMSRLRHLAVTKWGKDIDTNRWGMVDTDEVKDLVKFLGWGTPQSALHQQSSAAPSTAATATTTSVSTATTAAQSRPATATTTSVSTATTGAPSGPATATTTPLHMATTAAPSTEATAGKSRRPNPSPSAKKHYKIRKCPLCKKDQTRHLLVHVRKGEIPKDRITALVQYADKGGTLHREEQWMKKRTKIVRARRRFFKCPICELVTAYLPTHFANKHGIPRSSEESERYMLLARAYEGDEELKYIKSTKPSKETASPSSFMRLFNCNLRSDTESDDESYHPSADEEEESSGSDDSEVIPPTPERHREQQRQIAQAAAENRAASESESSEVGGTIQVFKKVAGSKGCESKGSKQGKAETEVGDGGDANCPKRDDGDDEEDHVGGDSEDDGGKGGEDGGCEGDEDEDEDEVKKSFSNVLKMKNPSAPRHIWLIRFHEYLQSLAGKALTKVQADQHASQIYLMLQSIDPALLTAKEKQFGNGPSRY